MHTENYVCMVIKEDGSAQSYLKCGIYQKMMALEFIDKQLRKRFPELIGDDGFYKDGVL